MCLLKFQVRVINTLTDLNEQLLQSPFLNSSNPGSRTPVTVCLFHSLNNVMKAGEASRPRHGHSVEQVGTVCARDQREANLAGVEVRGQRPSRRES